MFSPLHENNKSPARILAGLLSLGLVLLWSSPSFALETPVMRAPESSLVQTPASAAEPSPSPLRSTLLVSVRWFQRWISPIDGSRCGFSPTCSQFGYEAVRDHGPALGVTMTADRLMRCNYWTKPGTDYARLPNGALHDSVESNHWGQP